ncbi:MAG: helix-hairpin-helix domain-containing protein [Planctomycetaceae bacterium]|nr:helix-hairpin-helix domain-containing protein [Planctomycetaceae bacterium]
MDLPLRQIQTVVELLDEGNTVPFITRYRKDQTGGLDEEQIRDIQDRLAKTRLLADRKQTILRSIESQGKLTEKLSKQILSATTTKRLEDLYLPYKPKKQTLATLARSRGLEQLAQEILEAAPTATDLDARAADFVNTDRQVPTAADALLGAGHILAEQFSEQAELRQRLREVLQRIGVLVSNRIAPEPKPVEESNQKHETAELQSTAETSGQETIDPEPTVETSAQEAVAPQPMVETSTSETIESQPIAETSPAIEASSAATDFTDAATAAVEEPAEPVSEAESPAAEPPAVEQPTAPTVDIAARRKAARQKAKAAAQKNRDLKKKKLEEKRIKAFQDYFDYHEEIRKIPPHRVLAINRGERARVLRVRLDADLQALVHLLDELLVPPGHPHADYLRGCARDALTRLILPSLEREVRRELTDRAETHAVGVFARNLRNLLLQPPVHNQRLLAVDPGFKSGCKLAALDQFGNLLGHEVIYLVGKPDRTDEAKQKVLSLIGQHQLTVVVIGNGTACRHTEDFFAGLIENELKDQGLAYVIVNEAGASVYSTSRTGREELPDCDATLRGAISIGRRLQDPLSELVKIDPASIGVGLYQHDVKAKHLRTSLDEVVESCVNYVGVDVNTASPALLRYVSGLNQLTARRLYEHRCEHGPFRSREQLREVPGLGEATFVQAAGFLKIPAGDNPLDSTWIHPESYPTADRVLERLHGAAADLREKETAAALAERIAQVDRESLAKELEVGTLTLSDILAQLARPGRDPREDLPAPVFKRGVIKLEDLSPGMELTGTVLNVVDFGAFVDIGMHDSGLVHVSQLADKYVRDPHDVVAVGDVVKVWVVEVDKQRRRVSLTMILPGTQRTGGRREGKPQQPQARPQQTSGERPPRPPREQRKPVGAGGPPKTQRPPRTEYKPKRPPKPVKPITDEMKTGKAPMRSFSDLIQFYEARQEPEPKPDDSKKQDPAE